MKFIRTAVTAVVLAAFLCTAAFATAVWLKDFNKLYKPKAGAALAKAKCGVCHVQPNGKGGLNAYGKMLGKKPGAAALKAVEKKDADKDGVSNIAEIKKGTLPGDKKSK